MHPTSAPTSSPGYSEHPAPQPQQTDGVGDTGHLGKPSEGASPSESPRSPTLSNRRGSSGTPPLSLPEIPDGADLNLKNEQGDTALHLAVSEGRHEMVSWLLKSGADVNPRDGLSRTPLHLAAQTGDTDLVAMLLAHGADLNATDSNGQTAVHVAASHGQLPVVQALLQRDRTCANLGSDQQETALHLAAAKGHTAIIDVLLAAGADIAAEDQYLQTPLLKAAMNGHAGAIHRLIDQGADSALTGAFGQTPLHAAARHNHLDALSALLERGAPVDVTDEAGMTALDVACASGRADAVQVLLRHGAKPRQGAEVSMTTLDHAASTGQVGVLAWLLDAGAEITGTNSYGRTVLHTAAMQGRLDALRFLLDKGARPDVKDMTGATPLHMAASQAQLASIQLLLERHADVRSADHWGQTPLHHAATSVRADAIRLLIDHGADIDARDSFGSTALYMAANQGRAEAVSLLLAKGASPDLRTAEGSSPLEVAAQSIYLASVDSTALQDNARKQGYLDTMRALLEGGARLVPPSRLLTLGGDFREKVAGRLKPSSAPPDFNLLDWSIGHEFAAVIELLLRNGARPAAGWRREQLNELIHDLLVSYEVALSPDPPVVTELGQTLVSLFESRAAGQMTDDEVIASLREAGLTSPVIRELMTSFRPIPEIKRAISGGGEPSQAQVRFAVAGMLAEFGVWELVAPQGRDDYQQSDISASGKQRLRELMHAQVEALAAQGEAMESALAVNGAADLLPLCLQHLPVPGADDAALRRALTGQIGLYGPIADRVLQAWTLTLANHAETVRLATSSPEVLQSVPGQSLLAAFERQLKAQLNGVTRLSQMESMGLGEPAAQLMTQLMMRQWDMLQ